MSRTVVLLRGINVGGRNRVTMADLRATFTAAGYESVATYIQTGNVLLESAASETALEQDVEALLRERLELPVVVVVRERDEMERVVSGAPEGFGTQPDTYHSDVVFLKAPLTSDEALAAVSLREGVDRAWPGERVLYLQRVSARRAQSRISKVASTPEYQRMTIRNWATTTKILALLDTE